MEIQARVGNVTDRDADVPADETVAPRAAATGGRALLVLALAVLAFQLSQGLNGDSSWLMTVGDRWLAGARPFIDILESNPPSSVLLLMPALLLGRLTGLAPEPIAIVMVVLAAVAVIEWTVRLMAAQGQAEAPSRTRLALAFALLVLPMSTFAEREHMGVIALVPMWAAMLVRADGRAVSRALLVTAGIGAGVAMCIKPQFALAILLPAVVAARRQRDFTLLFAPEYWIACAVVAGFAGLVLVQFPAYADQMVPLVLDLYRPVREPMAVLLTADVVPWVGLAVVGLLLVARDRVGEPQVLVPLLAGLALFIAVIEQGKGFAYHYYPMVAAIVPALADRGVGLANARFDAATGLAGRLGAVVGFLCAALGMTFATLYFLGLSKPMAGLMQPIAAIAPKPKMVSISPHIWVSHPLVRDVGGTWIGSVPNQWMTIGALYKLGVAPPGEAERQRLIGVIAADKARLAGEIALFKPDIVLVERDDRVLPAWFASEADLRAYLAGYHRAADYVGVEVWARDRAGPLPTPLAGAGQ